MILILIFAFILGIVIGSFLNVVAFRYNTGMSIVSDRSKCFSCGKQLTWYELTPIVSYVIQRGRCRGCGSKYSVQYALVELCMGLLFTAIVWQFPPVSIPVLLLNFLYMAIWSVLAVIFIYDLHHKIIPDGLALIFSILSFISVFLVIQGNQVLFVVPTILNIAAGPILFVPFYLLWLLSKGTWMGLGDAKLAIGIGWFLGLVYGVSAIILAFWIGALFAIVLIVLQKVVKRSAFKRFALSLGIGERIMKSEIPFAPFLIIGMLIIFFYHVDIIGLSLFL